MRVPWTARRSNQSILKEISPGCSLAIPSPEDLPDPRTEPGSPASQVDYLLLRLGSKIQEKKMASRGLMSCDLLQVKASLVVLRRIAALCVVSLVSVRLMLPPSPDHWYHRGFSWCGI